MQASEGKVGRVFVLHLEAGEKATEAIEQFAREKGIHAAQLFAVAKQGLAGIIAPDGQNNPRLRFPPDVDEAWDDGEVVVQELLGINFQRVKDPASGKETLTRIVSTKTRVMEKPAPAPEEQGPGTIPVYLFNAEFN